MKKQLTSKQKVAIVVFNLGQQIAAEVVKELSQPELIELGITMNHLEKLGMEKSLVQEVLDEFIARVEGVPVIPKSSEHLFEILNEAVGRDKAYEVMRQLKGDCKVRPFENLRNVESDTIGGVLAGENPQTVALVLSHLESKQAAEVLKSFPHDKQTEIVNRLLSLEEATFDVMEQIGEMILSKISVGQGRLVRTDSEEKIKNLASVLNLIGENDSKNILLSLEEEDPEMAERIQEHMFIFTDLIRLTPKDIRNILTQVDTKTTALALKGISKELQKHVLSALSKRIREIVLDEKDMLGSVPRNDVAEAQRDILEVARSLQKAGKLQLRKQGEEMQMVE